MNSFSPIALVLILIGLFLWSFTFIKMHEHGGKAGVKVFFRMLLLMLLIDGILFGICLVILLNCSGMFCGLIEFLIFLGCAGFLLVLFPLIMLFGSVRKYKRGNFS